MYGTVYPEIFTQIKFSPYCSMGKIFLSCVNKLHTCITYGDMEKNLFSKYNSRVGQNFCSKKFFGCTVLHWLTSVVNAWTVLSSIATATTSAPPPSLTRLVVLLCSRRGQWVWRRRERTQKHHHPQDKQTYAHHNHCHMSLISMCLEGTDRVWRFKYNLATI